MQYSTDILAMQGRVTMARPGIDPALVRAFLNERMRAILDQRPFWAGLLKRGVISIPNAYTAGGVSVTTGSSAVTGTATAWPVSDAVNSTINEQVRAGQQIWVTPSSLVGITADTVLYIDANGPEPEACPVLDMLKGRVLLNFSFAHAAGVSATASSLNGLQLRVNGSNSPVFSIIAVTSDTTLVIDNPWGAASLPDAGYQIIKMYITIDPRIKGIREAFDPVQKIPLRVHVPQKELDMKDPNRTAYSSPQCLADLAPNVCRNQQFEIWPPQTTAYQIPVRYHIQWPDMRLPTDFPPPFINPNVLIYGALADAFRTPCPRPPENKDPGFSLETSDRWQKSFETAVLDLMEADEALYQTSYTWETNRAGGALMGADWQQSHDWDSMIGNF